MSLETFLLSIWTAIQRVFKRLPQPLKAAIHIGVVVTEQIKNFVDTGAVDILSQLIPSDVDDHIKEILKRELPRIVANLKLAEQCGHETDPDKILKCAIATLQSIGKDFEIAFLHSLAIMIAQVAADGKLSWTDGVHILEWYYKHV